MLKKMFEDAKQTKCPSYQSFEGELVGPTTLPPNSSFEIVCTKKLKDYGNLIGVFSMKPRMYPVKYADQAGEQKYPGNAALNFSTEKFGFPISIDIARDSPILFSTTLPIIDNLDMSLSTTLERQMKLSFTLNHANPYTNISFNYSLANSFKHILYDIRIASGISKKYFAGFGATFSSNGPSEYNLLASVPLKKINTGFLVTAKGLNYLLSFIATSYVSDHTIASTVLQIDPKTLRSDLLFGYQRSFMSSRVFAVVNSRGSMGSVFQKDFSEKYSIIISSFADHFQKLYSLGISLAIRDTN